MWFVDYVFITFYLGDINSKMEEVLGYMSVELDGRFSAVRSQETNLGIIGSDVRYTL